MVQGYYCQNCGQENIEPKETFWHMVTHFFYDITHFDGSFFVTVKDLLIKPGFLTKEYMRGRRKMYLHPIRMYVFSSAVFFVVFYALFSLKNINTPKKNTPEPDYEHIRKLALKKAKTRKDSADVNILLSLLRETDSAENNKGNANPGRQTGTGNGLQFSFSNEAVSYQSIQEYDSIQQLLPKGKRDNWFERILSRRTIALNVKYGGDQARIGIQIWNKLMHSFPYLLFVSLPLYALFLKLLYARRKQFYYADHGVFLIHLYIFTFLLLLVYFSADKLESATEWRWVGILKALVLLTGIVYALKAMKNFYEQGWGKTILKFIIFNILSLVALMLLFTGFLVISFYQV
jgi:hypothetical protein